MDIFDQLNPPKSGNDIFDQINPQGAQPDVRAQIAARAANPPATAHGDPNPKHDVLAGDEPTGIMDALSADARATGAGLKGLADLAGIPTNVPQNMQELMQASASFNPMLEPFVATAGFLSNAAKTPAQVRTATTRTGKAQAIIRAIPGAAPVADVMAPAVAASENRPVTAEENLSAIRGGATVAGMMLAPKVGKALFPKTGETPPSPAMAQPEIAPPTSSGEAVSRESTTTTGKSLAEMTPDELAHEYEIVKGGDARLLEDLFGKDGATQYKRLERKANSTYASHEETNAAYEKLQAMERSLTEAQRAKLFGIGETAATPEEIKAYQDGLNNLDDESPSALGESLKWALTKIEARPIEQMSEPSKVAAAQMRHAYEIAKANGWNPQEVLNAALKGAANRFGPEADFMLQRYMKSNVPVNTPERQITGEAVSQPAPSGEATLDQANARWIEAVKQEQALRKSGATAKDIADAQAATKRAVDEVAARSRNDAWPRATSAIIDDSGQIHTGESHQKIADSLGFEDPTRAAVFRQDPDRAGWTVDGQFVSIREVNAAKGDLGKALTAKLGNPANSSPVVDAIFGKNAAKYRRLEQIAGDEAASHESRQAAMDEGGMMEAALTDQQRAVLAGKADPSTLSAAPQPVEETPTRAMEPRRSGALSEAAAGVNPPGVSEGARESSDILREAKAKIANAATIERYKYKDVALGFDKAGDMANIGNISQYERTGEFKSAPAGYSEFFTKSMEAAHEGLKQAYGDDSVGYVENYVRRAFKFASDGDASKASSLLSNWIGSLSANKTPLRGRVFDVPLDEALHTMRANGIKVEPVTTNPEVLRQWSMENANQAVTYKGAWQEAKARGLLEYVKQGERPGANLIPLDDRVAQVFRPTEEGPVKAGQYYAEPGVARIFNNAISKGFGGSPTYRGIREVNNALNSFNLGLSGYHMTFTGINSGLSDLSLGISHLLHGEFGEATVPTARSLVPGVSAGRHLIIGQDIINGVIAGEPKAMETLDALNNGGGRLQMDQSYKMSAYQNMMRAWYNNDYFRTAVHAPLAIIQKISQPLMEYAIPRIKLGAWLDMANAAVERLGPNATPEQITEARRRAWDNVDDRFGLMVHDNLFWNKTAADLAHVSVRSVGWNAGDIRWIGGAVKDIKEGNFRSDRVISALALPIYAGMIGAAYQYLHTGSAPQEIKDYYYPKNGMKDRQGNEDRTMPATYMRDVEGYRKAPLATVSHKLSPIASIAADLATNRDYMGNMIRNPEDPASTQLEQVGLNMLARLAPFSITQGQRQLKEAQKAGGNRAQMIQRTAEPFFGFPPAPREMVRSAEQNEAISEKRRKAPRAPMTPEQVQKLNERQ